MATEGSKETRFFEGGILPATSGGECVTVLLRNRICRRGTYGSLHAALIWMYLALGIQGKKGHEGELWGMGNLFKESLNKVKAQEIFANERPDLHFQIRRIDSQQLGALCPLPYNANSASGNPTACILCTMLVRIHSTCTSGMRSWLSC